jgi:peptidoglycan/LPS O-acetylase OafA/YrhL
MPSTPLRARPEHGYRPHLDGLRAIAVTMVVLFHLGLPWIPGGFVGVDVFFVISGYLITSLLLAEATDSGTVRLRRFYSRRVRRLLPAAAVTLLVVMVLSSLLLDMVAQQSIGHEATAAALYAANWHLVAGNVDYFTPGDVPSPLVHFWSLAVEEQFYLVWPAAFLLLWRLSTRNRDPEATRGRDPEATGRLLAGVVALGAVSLVLSLRLVASNAAYYGSHTRAYQLLAGAALAIVARRVRPRLPTGSSARLTGTAIAVIGLAALVVLAHGIADATAYPGTAGLAVTAASVALLAGIDLAPRGLVQRVLGSRVPATVGRLSYSLYLWHWPVIVFAPVLAERWGRPALAERPVMVAVMSACAIASYLVVERPVRFHLVPRAPSPAIIGVGLVVSITVALVGVPLLQPREGFQAHALAAVGDLAEPGPCPYFREQWGPPSRSEPCVYRRGGPFTVALVGDSHAQQWQPAFDVLAERYDLTVIRITRRGCPANRITVVAFDDQGLPHADVPCSLWRDRVYQRTIDRFDPDLVYVETRSHEWTIRDGDRDVDAGDPDHLALWSAGWGPTLDTLTSRGARVVVAKTTPNIPWRVPACLAEHDKDTGACDMPLDQDRAVRPFNRVIAGLPQQHPHVTVVDPTPIICPGGVCPAMIDGLIVHRDDDHISASFARASADPFEAMLERAGVHFPRR